MAVAIPLFAATGSIWKVLVWTLGSLFNHNIVNGLAEPLGVVLGAALLGPYLSPYFLHSCLAVVAGIMACISVHELMPSRVRLIRQWGLRMQARIRLLLLFSKECWFVLLRWNV